MSKRRTNLRGTEVFVSLFVRDFSVGYTQQPYPTTVD